MKRYRLILTTRQLLDVGVAVGLRAEACEENIDWPDEAAKAKAWRRLLVYIATAPEVGRAAPEARPAKKKAKRKKAKRKKVKHG